MNLYDMKPKVEQQPTQLDRKNPELIKKVLECFHKNSCSASKVVEELKMNKVDVNHILGRNLHMVNNEM